MNRLLSLACLFVAVSVVSAHPSYEEACKSGKPLAVFVLAEPTDVPGRVSCRNDDLCREFKAVEAGVRCVAYLEPVGNGYAWRKNAPASVWLPPVGESSPPPPPTTPTRTDTVLVKTEPPPPSVDAVVVQEQLDRIVRIVEGLDKRVGDIDARLTRLEQGLGTRQLPPPVVAVPRASVRRVGDTVPADDGGPDWVWSMHNGQLGWHRSVSFVAPRAAFSQAAVTWVQPEVTFAPQVRVSSPPRRTLFRGRAGVPDVYAGGCSGGR